MQQSASALPCGARVNGRPAAPARRPRVAAAPAPAPWAPQQQQQPCLGGPRPVVAARCSAAVSGWRALDSGSDDAAGFEPAYAPAAPGSKFDRILRFVEQHDISGTCAPAAMAAAPAAAPAQWHHSYDEEAEEGEEPPPAGCAAAAHEAAQLAAAAASLAAPSCSVAFLYPGGAAAAAAGATAAAAGAAAAGPGAVGSLSYFLAKPWDHSFDEEAEGCYELAAATATAARDARLATFKARRAESIAVVRARRAALRAAPGDLESMQPWVADAAAAAAAAAVKRAAGRAVPGSYPHLQAFLSARTGARGAVEGVIEALQRERGLQARHNQEWVYTFDEEVHGALSSM